MASPAPANQSQYPEHPKHPTEPPSSASSEQIGTGREWLSRQPSWQSGGGPRSRSWGISTQRGGDMIIISSVVARGWRLSDGRPVYFVPNLNDPQAWHPVVVLPTGLQCDCIAQRVGLQCLHRRTVRAYLRDHLDELLDALEHAPLAYRIDLDDASSAGTGGEQLTADSDAGETEETCWRLTDKGRALAIGSECRALAEAERQRQEAYQDYLREEYPASDAWI